MHRDARFRAGHIDCSALSQEPADPRIVYTDFTGTYSALYEPLAEADQVIVEASLAQPVGGLTGKVGRLLDRDQLDHDVRFSDVALQTLPLIDHSTAQDVDLEVGAVGGLGHDFVTLELGYPCAGEVCTSSAAVPVVEGRVTVPRVALEDFRVTFIRTQYGGGPELDRRDSVSVSRELELPRGTRVPVSRGADCVVDTLALDPCPLTQDALTLLLVAAHGTAGNEVRVALPRPTTLTTAVLRQVSSVQAGGELGEPRVRIEGLDANDHVWRSLLPPDGLAYSSVSSATALVAGGPVTEVRLRPVLPEARFVQLGTLSFF